jgi:hypothetical protein
MTRERSGKPVFCIDGWAYNEDIGTCNTSPTMGKAARAHRVRERAGEGEIGRIMGCVQTTV